MGKYSEGKSLPITGDGGNLSPIEINGSYVFVSEFRRARTSPLEWPIQEVCHRFKGESKALVSDWHYELFLNELGSMLRSFLLMAIAEVLI